MNYQLKNKISTLVLASLIASPFSAHARVVEDINKAMTDLLGHVPAVTNVFEAQDKYGLNTGKPATRPWSSSYWPDITGGITNHFRTRDRNMNELTFFGRYWLASPRFINDHKDVKKDFLGYSQDDLNNKLSASEKYDFLLGDPNFTFTENVMSDIDFRENYRKTSVMASGKEVSSNDLYSDGDDNNTQATDVQQFADDNSSYASFDNKLSFKYWKKQGGSLAYWFGICDGWGPAAVTLPRPVNPVTVMSAYGKPITFYPDDLKALGSYLFARTNNDYMTTMNYHFAGRPCAAGGTPDQWQPGDSDPKAHPGVVKDFRCNDVDAGVWHLALLNRIGMDHMGFVFEIDNNKKINNHPMSNYSLKYFSPMTGEELPLKDAAVKRELVHDLYWYRRNPKAAYLVGVKSKFTYMNYQWAEDHHGADWYHDHGDKDEFKDLEYTYDLELDLDGNILGGEWGDRSQDTATDADGNEYPFVQYADQPDFIWMAAPEKLPYSQMSPVWTNLGTPNAGITDPDLAKALSGIPASPVNATRKMFGNMTWEWDGQSKLPDMWMFAAKDDEKWQAPVIGEAFKVDGQKEKIVQPAKAKNSTLKSAQPLSNIVYFLFDKAYDPNQL